MRCKHCREKFEVKTFLQKFCRSNDECKTAEGLNNLEQIKGIHFRLNYTYRPGDDLFIVYRDVRNQLNPEFSDRAILVKFTRSFGF